MLCPQLAQVHKGTKNLMKIWRSEVEIAAFDLYHFNSKFRTNMRILCLPNMPTGGQGAQMYTNAILACYLYQRDGNPLQEHAMHCSALSLVAHELKVRLSIFALPIAHAQTNINAASNLPATKLLICLQTLCKHSMDTMLAPRTT